MAWKGNDSERVYVERYAPIWRPRFKMDVEKLREDRGMIKGLENGNFEDGWRHYLVHRKDG